MNGPNSAPGATTSPDHAPRRCRSCGAVLDAPFLDLGCHPPSNAFIAKSELDHERRFPLRVRFCSACLLVQADEVVGVEQIFNAEYAYFSSFSTSWLAHARRFAKAAIARFGLDAASRVIEVGSNDGYLLQYFAEGSVQVLGIDASDSAAAAARARGIPTLTAFFGAALGQKLRDEGRTADLMYGANVLAHVPDLNDFLAGFAPVLKPGGTVCFEFPHLLRLLEGIQFDTIYHEHFSYLSLAATELALARHDLAVYDLEELPTHGGSLRLYCAKASTAPPTSEAVNAVRRAEQQAHVTEAATLQQFAQQVAAVKTGFLAFLATASSQSRRIVAYGAAAKGNTFLNTCGVTDRDIVCVFDRNPHKQGRLMPGSHIPVRPPEGLAALRPDYVLVLPWNLIEEVRQQLAFIAEWGGRLVTAIPDVRIIDPA